MSDMLLQRGAAIAAAAETRARARVADAVRNAMPGTVVRETGNGVAIEARGLRSRIGRAGLPWIGGLMR